MLLVRFVVDADVGAMGPVISKSSTSGCPAATTRLVVDNEEEEEEVVGLGVGVGGGKAGLGLGFDDAVADVRAALADCGVLVGVEAEAADFLDGGGGGAGRGFDC
jgi:hypothetical protein